MFESNLSTSRLITACAIVAMVVYSGCSSPKSQLVGEWCGPASEWNIGLESWVFWPDNTCQSGIAGGTCTYTVLDDGSINIKLQGVTTGRIDVALTGKIKDETLRINWGTPWPKEQHVLHRAPSETGGCRY